MMGWVFHRVIGRSRWSGHGRRLFQPLLLVGVYTGLALGLTDPLWRHFDRALPGCCDATQQAWAYWWTRYALLELGRWPFQTSYLFHPLHLGPGALLTLVSYQTLLSLPLQGLFGLTMAINSLILLSLVAAALAAYLLIRSETGHPVAAFVGSLMFAFAPPVFARLAYGHYATIAVWPMPLALWLWRAALRRPTVRTALGAGALLGLQAGISPYQGGYLLLAMGVLGLAPVWTAPSPWAGVRLFGRQGLWAGLAALVVLAPLLGGLWSDYRAGNLPPVPLSHAVSFAPDLLAYGVPSPLHPHLGRLFADLHRQIGTADLVRVVFPGYLALGLGLAGVIVGGRPERWPWVWGLGVLFLVSLGPLLRVGGQTAFSLSDVQFTIPLPFLLLSQVPLLGQGRVTANACFAVSLCLAVLSGFALRRLFDRVGRPLLVWALGGLLALGVVYEGLARPLGLTGLTVPAFYAQLAREPGEFALLEVPLGWRDGRQGYGEVRGEVLYYATVHHKPLVNGYVARAPDWAFAFFRSQAALAFLVDPRRPPAGAAGGRDQVQETLRALGVRYVVVQDHPERAAVEAYLERVVGLRPVYRDGQVTAYRVADGRARPNGE